LRLQLIPLLLQVASVSLRSGVYQDTDRTTIETTTVAARANPSPSLGLEARYLVDIISSASVDVISAATSGFNEIRHEAEGGLTLKDDVANVSFAYIYSVENDWESHTVNGNISRDFADHAVTIGIGGSGQTNAVGREGDRNFHRSLDVIGGSAFFTVATSPRDLVSLSYSLASLDGYQASPYRYVGVRAAIGPPLGAPENDPQTRLRHAVTLRWNRHVGQDSALRMHLRGYADDWGVLSGTAGAELRIGLGERWEAGLNVRGYAQTGADFYRATYTQPLRYMTADRELSPFVDAFGGATIGWRRARAGSFDDLHFELKAEGFGFWFLDFPRLPERAGVVGELAVGFAL
jgi:uncharacterized protein DUF3570